MSEFKHSKPIVNNIYLFFIFILEVFIFVKFILYIYLFLVYNMKLVVKLGKFLSFYCTCCNSKITVSTGKTYQNAFKDDLIL